jgi:hypothetical protein
MPRSTLARLAAAAAAVALACASVAHEPAPGGSRAWGFVSPAHAGFSVVYLEGPPRAGERLSLRIRDGRIEPGFSALGAGGTLEIRNEDRSAHLLAVPFDRVTLRLEPDVRATLDVAEPGARSLFLLDVPGGAEASVFVSPGPYAVVSPHGRYELDGLGAGQQRLFGWSPEEGPVFAWIQVRPDAVQRFDLQVR